MATKKNNKTELSSAVLRAQKNYEDAEKILKTLSSKRTSLLVGATVDDSEVNKLATEIKELEGLLTQITNQMQDSINLFNQEVNLNGNKAWMDSPEGQDNSRSIKELTNKKDDLEKKILDLTERKKSAFAKVAAEQERVDREAKRVNQKEIAAINKEINAQKAEIQRLEKIYKEADKQLKAQITEQQKVMAEETKRLRERELAAANTPAAIKKREREAIRELELEKQKHLKILSVVEAKQVITGKRKLKPGESIPIDVMLDTSVNPDGTRNHTVYHTNGKTRSSTVLGQSFRTPSQIADLTKNFTGNVDKKKLEYYGRFGTAHHKIIEDLLGKKGITATGKGGQLTPEDLRGYLVRSRATAITTKDRESLDDLSVAFGAKGGINETQVKKLLKTVNDFLAWKEKSGLSDREVLSEKTLGAVLKTPKGRTVPIGGTIDQLWFDKNKGSYKITDLKTSKLVDPSFGLQLGLYRMLGAINGLNIEDIMEIAHTPRPSDRGGNVAAGGHKLKGVEYDKLLEMIDLFEDFNEAKTDNERNSIRKKLSSVLGMGGLQLGVTQNTDEKSGIKSNLIGTRTLGQWVRDGHLEDMLQAIADPDQARHIRNNIYMRGKNGSFIYDSPEFDEYRRKHRPELYNFVTNIHNHDLIKKYHPEAILKDKSGVTRYNDEILKEFEKEILFNPKKYPEAKVAEFLSPEWRKKFGYVQEGYAGEASVLLGGMSITDWVNYIGSFDKGSKEQKNAIHSMLGLLNDLSTGQDNPHASRGWANDVYWSGRFFRSLSDRDQYDSTHQDVLSAIQAEVHNYSRLSTMSEERYETGQKYDPEENRAMQEFMRSITPIIHEEETDEWQEARMRDVNPGGGREISANESQQLAHRFARLLLAHHYYDRTYNIDQQYKEWQQSHPKSRLDRQGFARIFMGRSGNGQWSQYLSSQKAYNWVTSLGSEQDMLTPDKDGRIPLIEELAKLDDDYFGDDPEAVNFLRSLKKTHEYYPSMILESALADSGEDSYSNYIKNALNNKEQWWDSNLFDVLIKTGRRISTKPWEEVPNPGESSIEGTAKGQIDANILDNIRLAEINDNSMALTFWKGLAKSRMSEYGDRAELVRKVRQEGWEHFNKLGGVEHWKPKENLGDIISAYSPEEEALLRAAQATAAEEAVDELAEKVTEKVEEKMSVEDVVTDSTIKRTRKARKDKGIKRTPRSNTIEPVTGDEENPVGPLGGGPITFTGSPITINKINKAEFTGEVHIGGGDSKGDSPKDDNSAAGGSSSPKAPKPKSERAMNYDTRMADYYYRAYTDLDYQQYTIQQAKAKEVSQAKIEMYDVQLKEIEYQKKLALDQYNEYKKGHAGVDYNTIEGKRQSILAQKKAAFFTSQKEQTNLFNQIDVKALQWFKRMMEGGLILKFLQLARQGIRRVVNEAKQLDQVMTNLRIVTNANRDEASSMMNTYNELAKQLGVTTKEVASSANEWLRQGYEAAEVNDLITASMYLSKLGMIDSTAATKDLTSAIKGFKLEASEAMSVVDKLTSIDLRAATSAGEIAEGLAQFANLGSLSGVDIDQASAYVATIADVSQRSGASVGQALKTIISRFGNVKAGAFNKLNLDEENADTTEKLNDVERVLNKLGISMRDTNLQFKDFDEVLDEIAAKWETLDNVSKKAIANAFAGKTV